MLKKLKTKLSLASLLNKKNSKKKVKSTKIKFERASLMDRMTKIEHFEF